MSEDLNQKIEEILPKNEQRNSRGNSVFSRNKKLIIILLVVLAILYVFANVFASILFSDVLTKLNIQL